MAVNFNGDADYIACQDTNTGFPTGTWTAMAWIKPDVVNIGQTIFCWGERVNPATGFTFRLANDELNVTTWGIKDYNTTTFTLVTTEFQFVAAVFDSSYDVTFYHYLPSTDTWTKETIAHNVDMVNPGADADIIIGASTGNATADLSALYQFFDETISEVNYIIQICLNLKSMQKVFLK